MKKIKNKQGILIEEYLKIIIGIAVLVALIFLAVKLYGLFIAKNDLEKAQVNIDKISGVIESLETGKSVEYLLLNPNGWHVSVWPVKYEKLEVTPSGGREGADYTTYFIEGKPLECSKNKWDYCICLCKSASNRKDLISDCDGQGICAEVKNELISSVAINPSFSLEVNDEIYVDALIRDKQSLKFLIEEGKLKVYKDAK